MQTFKSVVFKHEDILYLGLVDDLNKISKFRPLNQYGGYETLEENQFSIVFVENDEKQNIKLSELQTITFKDEENPSEKIIIGKLNTDILFNVANEVLDIHKKITIH